MTCSADFMIMSCVETSKSLGWSTFRPCRIRRMVSISAIASLRLTPSLGDAKISTDEPKRSRLASTWKCFSNVVYGISASESWFVSSPPMLGCAAATPTTV